MPADPISPTISAARGRFHADLAAHLDTLSVGKLAETDG